ncbi:MAG: hypothetical protein DWQ04_18630 [Chloroflexi bacterium]|nr:MAG: hypothetical protein DWQ04_18630 [Chloroflexota bacterium]
MTENNHLTFNAIIRISLPDSPDVVTANVTLTAADAIPLEDGRFKHLTDCTLADLVKYADKLEADVWETYEEIKLIDLADDEAVDVAMTVTDAAGEQIPPSKDWFEKAVIVPTELEAAAEVVEDEQTDDDEVTFVAEIEEEEMDEAAVDETAVSEPSPSETTEDETEASDIDPEPEPEVKQEPAVEEIGEEESATTEDEEAPLETKITVSEPEPAFDELEGSSDPWIRPSTARVRIAGRRLPNGHPTWAAVDILMDENALRSAQAHALTSLDREVAGVMIGPRPEKQPDGRYVVHVIDTIIAKHTVMQGASVTYTPESWRYMNDKLWERYPDETAVIVGWYHTHPGFGIFLSGMDQFIHQNFFTQIWHIAYVLDPRAKTSGFFSWDREKTRVSPYEFQWPSWAARSW